MKWTGFVLIVVGLTAQCETPPQTPAGRQFARWLEVFNKGDRVELRDFFEKYFPARLPDFNDEVEFRESTGGFDLKKIEESTPLQVSGIVKEKNSDTYARFVFTVEEAEPNRLTKMELRAIPRPAEFPQKARLTEEQTLAALRAELAQRVKLDQFSGAVLVAKQGKPVYLEAYGLADRDRKIPNQTGTQFRIGSMNKMLTATAVMQLVAAGKISLQDPIGKYLPDYPNKDVASKVAVHHLLTHTGGTGDIFGPQYNANRSKLRELKDYVTLYGERGPEFEPGAQMEYSNYGYILLGVLIERASGQSYYDYVREHVFKPAGMTSTDSLPEDEAVPGRSVGYMKRDGEWKPNTPTLPYRGTSAGGGYSTVEDLLRFANAIMGHKLLNELDTATLTTGKVAMGPIAKYAYGFGDFNQDGVRWFGHNGGAPGMNGELRIFPESGYVIAVIANMDPPSAGQIVEFIALRLPVK